MAHENRFDTMFKTSFENIKGMLDSNTVVGNAIELSNGTSIIPISKLSVGFATGGLDSASADIERIVHEAILHKAYYVIVVHNHPSGDPKPSEADIKLTDELCKILKVSDILIYDHIIIGGQGIYSFRQNGLM